MDHLPENWPIWLVAAFLLLNFFKEKIYSSIDWLGQDLSDRREHRQKAADLEIAYQLSEQAVAQQQQVELVANAQESANEANEFTRQQYTRLLDSYIVLVDDNRRLQELMSKYNERLLSIDHQIRNGEVHKRLLTEFITEIYEEQTRRKAST